MAKNATTTQTTQRNPETVHAIQHFELAAPEPAKLRKFLEKQFGWTFETMKMPTGDYHAFRTPDGNGGGILEPMPGQPVGSTPYVNVADCDASLKACKKAGAEILTDIKEVPGAGRFFWFTYAGGPALACWQSTSPRA